MFDKRPEKSYMNHWYKWAAESKEKEQLFYDIRQLVEDMIKELVPPLLKEYSKLIDIDIITRLDGRRVDLDGIEKAIRDYIQDSLTSNFKH